MCSLRFLKAAIGAIAANSHFVRGNDHGGSGVLTVTNPTVHTLWIGLTAAKLTKYEFAAIALMAALRKRSENI